VSIVTNWVSAIEQEPAKNYPTSAGFERACANRARRLALMSPAI